MDLIIGQRHEVGKLEKCDRALAGDRASHGAADDGRFRQWGVANTSGKLGAETFRHTEDVPFGVLDILTVQGNSLIMGQFVA